MHRVETANILHEISTANLNYELRQSFYNAKLNLINNNEEEEHNNMMNSILNTITNHRNKRKGSLHNINRKPFPDFKSGGNFGCLSNGKGNMFGTISQTSNMTDTNTVLPVDSEVFIENVLGGKNFGEEKNRCRTIGKGMSTEK